MSPYDDPPVYSSYTATYACGHQALYEIANAQDIALLQDTARTILCPDCAAKLAAAR